MQDLKELLDLEAELNTRKRQNPLNFFIPLAGQDEFLADNSDTRVLFGGNRSGKTEAGADDVLKRGIDKPNQQIWCSAVSFADSVAIQQEKIWKLIPKHHIEYGRYSEINGFANRKLLLKNGSLYTFKSYDQGRDLFQGKGVHCIWLDEEPPYDIYRECRMRLLDYNGKMIITMTSLKGVTEVIDELYEGADVIKTRYSDIIEEYLPVIAQKNSVKFFMIWTTDNKHISQERTLNDIKLMTKQEIKARIYGIPTNLQGLIYPMFNKQLHVISPADMDYRDCQLWNILDPHDRKPWAIGWYAVHKSGSCCVIDEYPEKNFNEMLYDDKTYDDYADLIKAKEKTLLKNFVNQHVVRRIDPNFGNKTVQLAERQGGQSKTTPQKELAKRGLKYEDGIDALEAGHLKVREFLHYEIKDDQYVVSPRIYFLEHCQNHIRHISKYSRVDTQNIDEVRDKIRPMETYKDFADIIRYLCMADPRYIEPEEPEEAGGKAY